MTRHHHAAADTAIQTGRKHPASGVRSTRAARRPKGRAPSRALCQTAERLLSLLAAGARTADGDGSSVILQPSDRNEQRKGLRFPAPVVAALLSDGAVEWREAAGSRQLVLTAAGTLRLRRGQALVAPFAAQHGALDVTVDEADNAVRITNAAESPLVWLRRRKDSTGTALLGDAEFVAGERLRADLTLGQMMPRMGVDWGRQGRGGLATGLLPGEACLAARQRIERAMAAVGPEFSGILMDVCGFLKGLDQVERERRWPARSAKVVLVLALAALARHYGLANIARGPRRGGRIRGWAAQDARPEFQAGSLSA